MSDILTINSLSKSFTRKIKNLQGDNEDEKYWILNNLSLNIPKGKVIALIGGNGAGKTTLFNIISGYVKPESGSILYYNDKENKLIGMPPDRIALLGIGRMFQDNHIFQGMSLIDNMLVADSQYLGEIPFMTLIFRGKINIMEQLREEKAEKIFETILFDDRSFFEKRYMPAGNLSYGQQRLIGLARLFMRNYDLLLLDEPTAGVNPEVIEQIKKMITNFIKLGKTVLLIEHNLDVVKDISDFCCYMSEGRISLVGTPQDVIENEEVRKSYIGL